MAIDAADADADDDALRQASGDFSFTERQGCSSAEQTPSTVGVPTPPAEQAASCSSTPTPTRPGHLLAGRAGHERRRTTSGGALGGRVVQQRTSAPASLWLQQDRQQDRQLTGAAQEAEVEAEAATVAGRGSDLPLREGTKEARIRIAHQT